MFNPVIIGPDAIVNIESSVKTWFDGLLVNVQKRYSNRVTFNASYTLEDLQFLERRSDPVPEWADRSVPVEPRKRPRAE